MEHRTKGFVIYNAIDIQIFERLGSRTSVLQLEDRNAKVILNVGSYMFRKGHDILLKAFQEVFSKHPDAHLVIAGGNGPEFEKTEILVKQSSVVGKITLLKNLPHPEIFPLLKSASVCIIVAMVTRQDWWRISSSNSGGCGCDSAVSYYSHMWRR